MNADLGIFARTFRRDTAALRGPSESDGALGGFGS